MRNEREEKRLKARKKAAPHIRLLSERAAPAPSEGLARSESDPLLQAVHQILTRIERKLGEMGRG